MRLFGKGKSARLLVVLMSAVLVAGACGGDDDDEGAEPEETGEDGGTVEGGTLTFGADQDFAGYNKLTSKDNSLAGGQIMRQVWPSAYRARPDFSLEPYVIAQDAAVVGESPFVVEWKIRPEANWDDGVPISADDFEYVAATCNGKNKDADCADTSGYDLVTKIEKPDPKTIRLTFKQPYADYKRLFEIVPSHIAKQRGGGDPIKGWNTGFDTDPGASGGPWKVAERVKGDSLTLVRNDKFWGKKPSLEKIIFRFLPESLTQPDALRNGEVKMIYPQPQLDQVQLVEEIQNVHSEINFGPTFEHLTLNFKNEFLAVPEVRQALALGVDRQAIVDTLMKPFSDKASQLDNRVLVSTQKGYQANGPTFVKRDVAKATGLLEKAGFTKGDGGVYEKGGKKLSLRLSTTSGNDLREQQGVLIQGQLKDIGIDIRIANAKADTLFGELLPKGDFDIANFAWVGTPFPASGASQLYSSASDSNYGKYANPAVDKLMLEAVGEIDETARLALLDKIDEAMWADLPNIPLYQKPTFLAYYESYANITDNTTTESPFWNSEEWALKASAK
ncbi:MAG TPA: ABC transporter family substrate-binding protein [Acidimicrobiia bacterium]|nr:ABC transporter family substrate-binding protein [Acidimicrobiia bacterium]